MTIARPVAQRREWPQTRSARAIRQATAMGTPTPSTCAVGARAREPTQWPHACDQRRATHRALPACPPSYADYILRLQDTKPESLEIMLRLLIVALPLVVALPAPFDEQEANAIQFEVQSPLQFEVLSPPESRPLLPAALREINTQQPRHILHSARWQSLPPMPAHVARSSRQHASACTSCLFCDCHRPACASGLAPTPTVRLLPLLCAACGCALRGRRGSRLL